MKTFAIGLGIAIGIFRIALMSQVFEPEAFGEFWGERILQGYKALAHLYVGGVGASWLDTGANWKWAMFWFLIAVELSAVAVKLF